jgi:hypothetical protein
VDEIEASKIFVLDVKRCVGVDLANEELGVFIPLIALLGSTCMSAKVLFRAVICLMKKKLKSLSHLLKRYRVKSDI